jgi:hypothetical protein
LVTWYQTFFKLDINGGPKLQGSHKQYFIFVSSACKASTKSVAESLNFKFVCFVEIMVCGTSFASRKHTYQKDKEAVWKFFVDRHPSRNVRNQLSLKAKNGGLALINVDLKAKALL